MEALQTIDNQSNFHLVILKRSPSKSLITPLGVLVKTTHSDVFSFPKFYITTSEPFEFEGGNKFNSSSLIFKALIFL